MFSCLLQSLKEVTSDKNVKWECFLLYLMCPSLLRLKFHFFAI
ncbi:hypothetical protein SAMN04487897_11729 [Paenibacillus sp. yr247]|nr:hypothetical protein SAMN04487897_11729 [Paenibacillus sp. yr247]